MKAGRKILKADEQMVEEHPSSFGGFPGRDETAGVKKASSCGSEPEKPRGKTKIQKKVESSGRFSKKKLNNSKEFKHAKERYRKVEVEIAEWKGYTKCLKQWVMEETRIMESAILELEIEVGRARRMNGMVSLNNQIMNDYIKGMLGGF